MPALSRHLLAVLLLAFPIAALPAQDAPDARTDVQEVPVRASSSAPTDAATSTSTGLGGPRATGARVGIDVRADAATAAAQPDDSPTSRRGVRHMIVGGATIIVGGLVGDDAGTAISIAGAALLIYGVYLYLQGS